MSVEAKARRAEQAQGTTLLEGLLAALGLAMIVYVLGLIAYKAMENEQAAPIVSAEVLKVIPNGEGLLVTVRVKNKGARTAASLDVEGTLESPGETEPEKSSVTFSYLPSHSMHEGGLFFTKNPHEGKLELRPLGFQEP